MDSEDESSPLPPPLPAKPQSRNLFHYFKPKNGTTSEATTPKPDPNDDLPEEKGTPGQKRKKENTPPTSENDLKDTEEPTLKSPEKKRPKKLGRPKKTEAKKNLEDPGEVTNTDSPEVKKTKKLGRPRKCEVKAEPVPDDPKTEDAPPAPEPAPPRPLHQLTPRVLRTPPPRMHSVRLFLSLGPLHPQMPRSRPSRRSSPVLSVCGSVRTALMMANPTIGITSPRAPGNLWATPSPSANRISK